MTIAQFDNDWAVGVKRAMEDRDMLKFKCLVERWEGEECWFTLVGSSKSESADATIDLFVRDPNLANKLEGAMRDGTRLVVKIKEDSIKEREWKHRWCTTNPR